MRLSVWPKRTAHRKNRTIHTKTLAPKSDFPATCFVDVPRPAAADCIISVEFDRTDYAPSTSFLGRFPVNNYYITQSSSGANAISQMTHRNFGGGTRQRMLRSREARVCIEKHTILCYIGTYLPGVIKGKEKNNREKNWSRAQWKTTLKPFSSARRRRRRFSFNSFPRRRRIQLYRYTYIPIYLYTQVCTYPGIIRGLLLLFPPNNGQIDSAVQLTLIVTVLELLYIHTNLLQFNATVADTASG